MPRDKWHASAPRDFELDDKPIGFQVIERFCNAVLNAKPPQIEDARTIALALTSLFADGSANTRLQRFGRAMQLYNRPGSKTKTVKESDKEKRANWVVEVLLTERELVAKGMTTAAARAEAKRSVQRSRHKGETAIREALNDPEIMDYAEQLIRFQDAMAKQLAQIDQLACEFALLSSRKSKTKIR